VRVRLVISVLQPVFEVAQKDIGVAQFRNCCGFDEAAFAQCREYWQCWLLLQRTFVAAAYQLEYLYREFDFADAARAELDVVESVAAVDFMPDLTVQTAHRSECAVVEMPAEYEGFDHGHQRVTLVAGKHAALDPCVAFPGATLRDQVVFEHLEADHQRSAVAIRS
jgi:hypothetical protein